MKIFRRKPKQRTIQRYNLIDENNGELFDQDYDRIYTTSYEWFRADGKVGIDPIGRSIPFTEDFLVTEDSLVVRCGVDPLVLRGEDRSKWSLVNSICYSIKQPHIEPLNRLVGMLLSEEQAHSYLSHKDGAPPTILTFSLDKPSSELYVPGKEMKIVTFN